MMILILKKIIKKEIRKLEKEENQMIKKGASKRELKEMRKENLKKSALGPRKSNPQKVQIIREEEVQEEEEIEDVPKAPQNNQNNKKLTASRLKAYGINS